MNGHQFRTVLGIAAVFVFVRFVLDALASPWKERVEALLLLLLLALAWYALAVSLWLRRAAGPALLELPNPWLGIQTLQILLALAGVGLGVYLALTLPAESEAMLVRLLAAGLCLSFALLLALAALGRVRLTERGAFGPSGYIAWCDVAAYHWGGASGLELTLVPRCYLPFFAPLPWAVPAARKGEAEAVLARHAPTGPAAQPGR